jgi:hypothetical protein
MCITLRAHIPQEQEANDYLWYSENAVLITKSTPIIWLQTAMLQKM